MANDSNFDRNRVRGVQLRFRGGAVLDLGGRSTILKRYFHLKNCGKTEVIYFNIPSATKAITKALNRRGYYSTKQKIYHFFSCFCGYNCFKAFPFSMTCASVSG